MKKTLSIVGVLLLFLAGFAILLYPTVSNWLYERNSSKAIQEYTQAVERLPAYDKEEQLRLAAEYNNALTGQGIKDPFIPGSGIVLPDNYLSVLNVSSVMAYIDIPKINVYLPVRHGVSEEVLQRGVGHLEATAFPVGGEGTHCVLTGHRALPEAKMFTNLDKLGEGDVFLLHVLEDTLCYQVDQVLIVEPDDVEELRPLPGEDYCTLITCTPYSINSHRMLVRGSRIPYSVEELPQEIIEKMNETAVDWRGLVVLGFAGLWAVFLVLYFITGRKGERKGKRRGHQ